jgi:hypothetical protein
MYHLNLSFSFLFGFFPSLLLRSQCMPGGFLILRCLRSCPPCTKTRCDEHSHQPVDGSHRHGCVSSFLAPFFPQFFPERGTPASRCVFTTFSLPLLLTECVRPGSRFLSLPFTLSFVSFQDMQTIKEKLLLLLRPPPPHTHKKKKGNRWETTATYIYMCNCVVTCNFFSPISKHCHVSSLTSFCLSFLWFRWCIAMATPKLFVFSLALFVFCPFFLAPLGNASPVWWVRGRYL